MIYRKMESEIFNWIREGKEALLVTGARQTGKTFLIRKCLEEFTEYYIEINLIEHPEYVSILEQSDSAADFLMRVSAISGKEIRPGHTILFLDEVQECKDIVTRIKFLVEDGTCRYVMSGSLLGIELSDLRSAPVGYLRILDMYPVDMKEFYLAAGVQESTLALLKDCFFSGSRVDAFIHKKMLDVFFLYLIVGGMPEAVQTYIETNDINKVAEVHKKVIRLYKQDFTRYEQTKKIRLREIYDAIPAELNEKNKRFYINHLGKGKAYERLENGFLWLKDAGVALPVYNVTELKSPLLISQKRNLFKLFLSDVGLLTSQYPASIKMELLRQNGAINNGALFENVVVQELASKGFPIYYYNSKSLGEIDAVIELDGKVLPIEVKSGKTYRNHRALDNILKNDAYSIEKGYLFCTGNIEKEGQCHYFPIYMLMFLEEEKIANPIFKLNLEGV